MNRYVATRPGPAAVLALALLTAAVAGCGGAAPDEPAIVSRSEWGAQPPIMEMEPHEIRYITIHHTAFYQQPDRSVAEKMRWLQDFSQGEAPLGDGRTRGAWADIPYHFFISSDGVIAEARDVAYAGDTNTGYDPTGHLLIVLEGNFEEEEPTEAQLSSLRRMVGHHAARWGVPPERIASHRDYTPTLCPGANLYPYLDELRGLVAARNAG